MFRIVFGAVPVLFAKFSQHSTHLFEDMLCDMYITWYICDGYLCIKSLAIMKLFFSYTSLVSVMYVFFVYKICFWFNVNGKRTSMEILTFCHSYFAINVYWRDVGFEGGFGDCDSCKQIKTIKRFCIAFVIVWECGK